MEEAVMAGEGASDHGGGTLITAGGDGATASITAEAPLSGGTGPPHRVQRGHFQYTRAWNGAVW